MNMYKHKLVIFCKTCIRDIKNFQLLLDSIKKYNKENIPVCISVSRKEQSFFINFLSTCNYFVHVFIDEDITNFKYQGNDLFYKDWLPQQFVKLELYKTNFAKHYIIIDSDCYFIKDFYIKDFLFDNDTPYLPITGHTKGERSCLSLISEDNSSYDSITEKFFGKTYRSITIDMPFVLTSEYVKNFESYLKKRNSSFKEIILLMPFEMQWYLEYVLLSRCKYMPTTAFFIPFHIEVQYQVFRWLGYDEDVFRKNYLGICMNKGHVKSIRYQPLFFGKYIIRKIINQYYNKTKGRSDYNIEAKNSISKIFSIKNMNSKSGLHREITIFGIKIKFRI